MSPVEALQLLEQVAANSAMPLPAHVQCKQAVRVLAEALMPRKEENPADANGNLEGGQVERQGVGTDAGKVVGAVGVAPAAQDPVQRFNKR